MRVTYKPQPRPRPQRGAYWNGDNDMSWDLSPTITVDAGPLPNPIGFAPWPKAQPQPEAAPVRRRRRRSPKGRR